MLLACGLFAAVALPTLGHPLLEEHAFRQTQTAFSVMDYARNGIDLLRPTVPVFGPPFVLPFEFPLFQAGASLLVQLGLSPDAASRTLSLAMFLVSVGLAAQIAFALQGTRAAIATAFVYLFSSFSLLWGHAALIESTATAFSLAALAAVIRWRLTGRSGWLAACAVALALALLVKATTGAAWAVPVVLVLFATLWSARRTAGWPLASATIVVLVIAVPFALGLAWTAYADGVKAASPATDWLTSRNLVTWNFGTLAQRLDVGVWQWILERAERLIALGTAFVLGTIALIRSRERAAWAGILLVPVAAFLVFTNLFYVHDYYLAAIQPAAALLLGRLLGDPAVVIPARVPAWLPRAALVAYLGFQVASGAGYWGKAYDANADPEHVLPLAAELAAHSAPGDLVVVVGLDWSPAILYYADRRGFMLPFGHPAAAVGSLIRPADYRWVLAYDPESADAQAILRLWPDRLQVSAHLFEVSGLGAAPVPAGSAAALTGLTGKPAPSAPAGGPAQGWKFHQTP